MLLLTDFILSWKEILVIVSDPENCPGLLVTRMKLLKVIMEFCWILISHDDTKMLLIVTWLAIDTFVAITIIILSDEENRSWVVNEIVIVTGLPTIEEVDAEIICRLFGSFDDTFIVPLWKMLE